MLIIEFFKIICTNTFTDRNIKASLSFFINQKEKD